MPALAEGRLPTGLGSSQRKDYKTRRLNREVGLPLHLHARESVRHESPVHASQANGLDPARCLGRQHGADWAQVEYSFSRTEGNISVGEQVIVDLMRKRGEANRISPTTCGSAPTIRRRA